MRRRSISNLPKSQPGSASIELHKKTTLASSPGIGTASPIYHTLQQKLEFHAANHNAIVFVNNLVNQFLARFFPLIRVNAFVWIFKNRNHIPAHGRLEIIGLYFSDFASAWIIENVNHETSFLDSVAYAEGKVNG